MTSPPITTVALLLLTSLISLSSALPSASILNGADALSDSGHLSMALTLEAISQSLVLKSPTVTIFAPPDASFRRFGQPSLSLLLSHFAAIALPLQTLRSLPAGTKIPTLQSGNSLIVTSPSSGTEISLNGVRVTTAATPIYDDGFLIILGVLEFFDPSFVPAPTRVPSSDHFCGSASPNGSIGFPATASSFDGAKGALRSEGYTVMASILDLQLAAFQNSPSPLTIFAPVDQAVENPLVDPSVFLRHVVPCRLSWFDLVNLIEGTELPTYMKGFTIKMSRSGDVLLLNEAPVYYPNLYYGGSIAVHGLQDSLVVPAQSQEEAADESESSPEQQAGSEAGDDSPDIDSEF
ncbi:putative fasciclin-like arabinogalactan protein 20 [Argentina anserina]|uniref:putative fasciclin-like arabinogalactan protein 20 n=1 Tax=Argentina anserina TaxID=57926 RepID=UPI0021762BAA|nr:putative fasciclin-like arabinogalactan protein 20 [Potentilla anserina]